MDGCDETRLKIQSFFLLRFQISATRRSTRACAPPPTTPTARTTTPPWPPPATTWALRPAASSLAGQNSFLQGSAKEWYLGCVITASWPVLTQPRDHYLADPCKGSKLPFIVVILLEAEHCLVKRILTSP